MSKSTCASSAPERILAAARRADRPDGVSLDQFINTALADKIAALEADGVFTRQEETGCLQTFAVPGSRLSPW